MDNSEGVVREPLANDTGAVDQAPRLELLDISNPIVLILAEPAAPNEAATAQPKDGEPTALKDTTEAQPKDDEPTAPNEADDEPTATNKAATAQPIEGLKEVKEEE
ncbi:hypothetical protein PENTCL1PPCAC_6058, partial [Pristionchus entomophagus]